MDAGCLRVRRLIGSGSRPDGCGAGFPATSPHFSQTNTKQQSACVADAASCPESQAGCSATHDARSPSLHDPARNSDVDAQMSDHTVRPTADLLLIYGKERCVLSPSLVDPRPHTPASTLCNEPRTPSATRRRQSTAYLPHAPAARACVAASAPLGAAACHSARFARRRAHPEPAGVRCIVLALVPALLLQTRGRRRCFDETRLHFWSRAAATAAAADPSHDAHASVRHSSSPSINQSKLCPRFRACARERGRCEGHYAPVRSNPGPDGHCPSHWLLH